MTPTTPYTADLGDREPLEAMRTAVERLRQMTSSWSPAQFERTYAPGKWTARQIFIHLAQTELALGNRARMALSTPQYQAQSFDQDRWMAIEGSSRPDRLSSPKLGDSEPSEGGNGTAAVEALVAMNTMNRALFGSLSTADRATAFSHPEYGALTVDWIVHQMAGHLLHHLAQLEIIART